MGKAIIGRVALVVTLLGASLGTAWAQLAADAAPLAVEEAEPSEDATSQEVTSREATSEEVTADAAKKMEPEEGPDETKPVGDAGDADPTAVLDALREALADMRSVLDEAGEGGASSEALERLTGLAATAREATGRVPRVTDPQVTTRERSAIDAARNLVGRIELRLRGEAEGAAGDLGELVAELAAILDPEA